MRSKEEIRRIVEGFAKSGVTRREYCAKHRVAMTTLDYWRRAHRKQKPRLVEVEVEPAQPAGGFALVLANGKTVRDAKTWNEKRRPESRLERRLPAK